jgi:uncharacterized protein YbjT (DUF2867 family)
MKKVLILGAGGKIAHWVIKMLANNNDMHLTLFLRHTGKLDGLAPKNAQIVQGDALDHQHLNHVMPGQDIVYANLSELNIDLQAKSVVEAMKAAKVNRLIFVTTLGIYDEVPGKFGAWNNRAIAQYIPPYRRAADIVEASGLDYTILRPAWLTNNDEIDYETTGRNEPFKGTEVSRKSVADLIVKIINSPSTASYANLGVDKPNTDGDKPAFK